MKFTCAQPDLLAAVSAAGRAVSSRTTMPILGHLLLAADGNRLSVAATDLELSIRAAAPAEVRIPGRITLPARILAEVASTLPDAPVAFTVAKNSTQAAIACEASVFEILGLPAEDFPALPAPAPDPLLTLDADVLRALIRSTVFAAAAEDARLFLTGVCVTAEGTTVRLVATDGSRLALREAAVPAGVVAPFSGIVPVKALRELGRILPTTGGAVGISTPDAQVAFTVGEMQLCTRLISGTFPAYQQIIPTSFPHRVAANTERLAAAVRRAAITAKDSATAVSLAVGANRVAVSSRTPEVGAARETIEAATEGDPIDIAFNGRYLLDALHAVDSPDVALELTGPTSPALIRPADRANTLHLLAPVRLYT